MVQLTPSDLPTTYKQPNMISAHRAGLLDKVLDKAALSHHFFQQAKSFYCFPLKYEIRAGLRGGKLDNSLGPGA